MKRSVVAALLVAALTSGCGGRSTLPSFARSYESGGALETPAFAASGAVYVAAASQVNVYASSGSTRIATIRQAGLMPTALTFDRSKNLYVAVAKGSSSSCGAGTVRVYARGATALKKKFSVGTCPIALRAFNVLTVLDENNRVRLYNLPSATLRLTIAKGLQSPTAMVYDHLGNLFVANDTSPSPSSSSAGGSGTVQMYPPGATSPKVTFTFSNGVPLALAVDSNNDVYVGADSIVPYGCSSRGTSSGPVGTVFELGPKGGNVVRQIQNLIPVQAVTVDKFDNLWVAAGVANNACFSSSTSFSGGVAEFGPTGTTATNTVTAIAPFKLAVDASGDVYFADCAGNTCSGSYVVREVKAQSTTILRTLKFASRPTALAVGP